ncbi:MAG TPA: FAD-binding oxidoreductase [Niabella sp.]|nr:FAD-binding oxidoreductase [Niabella sp.]
MEHILKIVLVSHVTHDVRCIKLEKPDGYVFTPGQATEAAVNKDGWASEKRPFTFTCLNEDPYLEFTIKCYNDHDGVTNQIGQLKPGDELIIDDPWGTISYKGQGYFIAGGAGITPFMAILRQLHKKGLASGNKLFFSNKTPQDIIYQKELTKILGMDALFVITGTESPGYLHDYINESFLNTHIDHFNRQFYICGPDGMIKSISDILSRKGVDPEAVIFEK